MIAASTIAMFLARTVFAMASPDRLGGDPVVGGGLYEQRCALCHGRDGKGGGQGPALLGLFNRRPASSPEFGYSRALRRAAERGLVWNVANLNQFLTDPNKFIPGTSMGFRTRSKEQRVDIIAYLQTLSLPPPRGD